MRSTASRRDEHTSSPERRLSHDCDQANVQGNDRYTALIKLIAVLAIVVPAIAVLAAGLDGPEAQAQSGAPEFINYESGPVRPIAITPSGNRLVVANTPAAQLDVLHIEPNGDLAPLFSVPVGLEPVAVAARTDDEIWVVNHLSDSVSIVDLATRSVTNTLLVGDEPRDIVFAGTQNARAFITTAHRGQRRMDSALAAVPGSGDPQLSTPGVGRADAWVFDTTNLGSAPGGVPVAIKSFFADAPRALTVSNDGSTVYLAAFMSGNQTAVVSEAVVCDGFVLDAPCTGDGITSPGGLAGGMLPGGVPGPNQNEMGTPAVEVGVIVKYDNDRGFFADAEGRNWSNGVRFSLPDLDVFAFDAMSLTELASYPHVGTTLFNMATHPATGQVFVSNTDSMNHIQFEGHGGEHSTVQGHLAKSQITVLDPASGSVSPVHLNSHIDYDVRPAPVGTKAHSLATPLDLTFSADGTTTYVAAYGSSRIGVLPTDQILTNSFDPVAASPGYISVTGGGPAGLVVHPTLERMYAFTRFDMGVSVIDLAAGSEIAHLNLFNPEPAVVRNGRPIMYDANFSSSNGEASCAACHIFGDVDALAWDLGDPGGETLTNPMDFELNFTLPGINGTGQLRTMNSLKGPMTTQTLKGLANHGAMHWRGDRSVGFFGTDATDEQLSFNNFIVAFPGLLGSELDPADPTLQEAMRSFTDFALTMMLPPNPVRNLDRSFTPLQQEGQDIFLSDTRIDSGVRSCTECHEVSPELGRFGTNLKSTFEGHDQHVKVPHFRNAYSKIGMFGAPWGVGTRLGNHEHQGPQIRGVGFLHDGSIDTMTRFFASMVFNSTEQQRIAIDAAMMVADSDLAPVVGQQVTVTADNRAAAQSRLDLLTQRAVEPFVSKELGGAVTECGLVASYYADGINYRFSYDPFALNYVPDHSEEQRVSQADLLDSAHASGAPVTFTCATYGVANRLGLDADLDGVFNRDNTSALGDVNCDGSVDIVDALLVAQFSVGNRPAAGSCPQLDGSNIYSAVGDVNADADADIVDALLIARCSVGNPTEFCPAPARP